MLFNNRFNCKQHCQSPQVFRQDIYHVVCVGLDIGGVQLLVGTLDVYCFYVRQCIYYNVVS